ncbi:MAG: hypothetical protein JJ913_12460 [Rhizobiaceae bacterium]|nr:hypothetical protein [Rhizobiaceae bacterium]
MNSQTHIIMGAALFGKPMPRVAWAAAAGGLVPDLPMFVIIGALRTSGHSFHEIFREIYWEHWWQIANGLGHSFWIWGGLAAISGALICRQRNVQGHMLADRAGNAPLAFAFSASALLHSFIDFLCHRDDAHMHLWPFTEWRFRSPVSYWDNRYYGEWFGLFEAAVGVLLVVILFRRYRSWLLRFALLVVLALYVAVPTFWIFSLGS